MRGNILGTLPLRWSPCCQTIRALHLRLSEQQSLKPQEDQLNFAILLLYFFSHFFLFFFFYVHHKVHREVLVLCTPLLISYSQCFDSSF